MRGLARIGNGVDRAGQAKKALPDSVKANITAQEVHLFGSASSDTQNKPVGDGGGKKRRRSSDQNLILEKQGSPIKRRRVGWI